MLKHAPDNKTELIKYLDSAIENLGRQSNSVEFYTLILGIAVYRLQMFLSKKNVEEILEEVIQGIKNIPPVNSKSLN